jgi:hypothetical protein
MRGGDTKRRLTFRRYMAAVVCRHVEGISLHRVEVLAVLEEASAPLNHVVRNRIASVRKLAFFVRRQLAAE